MSINHDRLRHAIFLATGVPPSPAETRNLALILHVPEEVLPFLLLRRNGFEASPETRQSLAAAVSRSPGIASSPRHADLTDARAELDAKDAVKDAMKALIDLDIAEQTAAARLDDALRDLVTRGRSLPSDAHLRIRR